LNEWYFCIDWKLNFNYWTGATRQDFAVGGVKWCPASRSNFSSPSPWGLLGGLENATLLGKTDCVALKVDQTKTNFTTSYFGKLLMRNCSMQQMIACRVIKCIFSKLGHKYYGLNCQIQITSKCNSWIKTFNFH
jgi:hypothetical protein